MVRMNFQRFSRFYSVIAVLGGLLSQPLLAAEFTVPPVNEVILGKVQYIAGSPSDTLLSIGQRYNLGVNAMLNANPGISETTPLNPGSSVVVPAEFLLPPLPRKGIIINLPEMRLYYFPKGSNVVMTFPVGIGKIGKTLPVTNTMVARKALNPIWTPPADIRAYNREKGIELPIHMAAGPDNPLGPYGIYLGVPTYLIHSTIFPESIGTRASFGCIRMHESDIKDFFPIVEKGTPVAIIDMPNKVGWEGNRLYLETHPPLKERSNAPYANLDGIVDQIQNITRQGEVTMINWQLVAYLADHRDGIPHEIGFKVN